LHGTLGAKVDASDPRRFCPNLADQRGGPSLKRGRLQEAVGHSGRVRSGLVFLGHRPPPRVSAYRRAPPAGDTDQRRNSVNRSTGRREAL